MSFLKARSAELRHYAKFYRNRTNHGRDIAIFGFCKMASAVILDFKNFTFLTVGTVKRPVLHQYAKFRWNRSNRDRGIVIFRFSKMAAAAILDFRNLKFLTVVTVKSSKCITARFRQNRLNGGWDMAFLDFPRWRHLRFSKFRIFNRRSRHEWRTAPLCQISSKLLEPRSRYVSFNIMLVWLENAYSRPFLGVLEAQFPQMMSLIVVTAKRTVLGRNHVIWAINRES